MKRTISMLIAACLCLSLAGCCQNAEPVQTTETLVTETEAATTQPTETTEVTVPTTAATEPTQAMPVSVPEPEDEDFVPVVDYIPDILVELKYASEDNFTNQAIYAFQDVYLRYGTVKKLQKAQEELRAMGLGLKIWDGFRPVSAQFDLWAVCPDPTFVANPETGYSSHSRGNTVDVTVVDSAGGEIEMPTGFDDFSALADRDYSDCSETAAENARMLQTIMENYGFKGYYGEWWHFSDTDSYPVEENFQPVQSSRWYANCQEYISLRTRPDTAAEVIVRIPVGGEFKLTAWSGDFAMVEYEGLRGYVLTGYILPAEQ